MAKKAKDPNIVRLIAEQFGGFSAAQKAAVYKLIEKDREVDGLKSLDFSSRVKGLIDLTYEWQLDTTTTDHISDMAERFRQLAKASLCFVDDENTKRAIEAGFQLGAAWERFRFETGPLPIAVESYMRVYDKSQDSLKARKNRREKVKAKARYLIGKDRSDVLEKLVEDFGGSSSTDISYSRRTLEEILREVRKEPGLAKKKPGKNDLPGM